MQGLFVLNIPDYNPKNWHGTLLIIAISILAMVFNTLLAKRLPLVEGLLVILHLIGIVLVIPLWVYLPLRTDGGVFTEFYNGGGWSTTGTSAMVGMLAVIVSMSGLDCSVHMGKPRLLIAYVLD
jgi:amino acid transporter